MSFGQHLHEYLQKLDKAGDSYSLCLNGAGSENMVDVGRHSPTHLEVFRADGKGGVYLVNTNSILTAEVIEHG